MRSLQLRRIAQAFGILCKSSNLFELQIKLYEIDWEVMGILKLHQITKIIAHEQVQAPAPSLGGKSMFVILTLFVKRRQMDGQRATTTKMGRTTDGQADKRTDDGNGTNDERTDRGERRRWDGL